MSRKEPYILNPSSAPHPVSRLVPLSAETLWQVVRFTRFRVVMLTLTAVCIVTRLCQGNDTADTHDGDDSPCQDRPLFGWKSGWRRDYEDMDTDMDIYRIRAFFPVEQLLC